MRGLKRLMGAYRRSGSARNFISAVREELFVRAWSQSSVRSLGKPLLGDYHPPKWIFLVGCFNSGTTILQKILSAHHKIASMPREGVRFTDTLSNLELHNHHMIWSDDFKEYTEPSLPDKIAYKKIKSDWGVFWKKDCDAFLDKSIANSARINWLNRVFPNSYFIGIHRNGYCVSEGLRRRAIPPDWLRKKTQQEKYPLETVAKQWVQSNELIMESFAGLPNGLLISFEDFVTDPCTITKRVLQHVGLTTDGINTRAGTLKLNDIEFTIHNPNPASHQRLDLASRRIITPIIRPTMRKLGYTDKAIQGD